MLRYLSLLLLLLFVIHNVFSQAEKQIEHNIQYELPYSISLNGKSVKKVFHPVKGYWSSSNQPPQFVCFINSSFKNPSFALNSFTELPLNKAEKQCVFDLQSVPVNYSIKASYTEMDGKGKVVLKGNAVRKDENGTYYRITKFNGKLKPNNSSPKSTFVGNSVLSNGGQWYKLGVVEDGVYKLDYQTLLNSSIISGDLSSDLINIYGNGCGMLSAINGSQRPDDLILNRIFIEDGGDDIFSAGDYILFYAKGPHRKNFDGTHFSHSSHLYSDSSFYFINISGSDLPHRIGTASVTNSLPNFTVTSFTDFKYLEQDQLNLIKSGSQWFGDIFDVQTSFSYSFDFPNLITDSVRVKAKLIGKSPTSSTFFSLSSGNSSTNLSVPSSGTGYYAPAGKAVTGIFSFIPSYANSLMLSIEYEKSSSPSSKGYLDFIEVNARRQLSISENDMIFSDPNSIGPGNVAEFRIENASQLSFIWEITNPTDALSVPLSINGDVANFSVHTDSLREFVAVSGNGFPTPTIVGLTQPQNIHSLDNADMIIISPEKFLSAALDLKTFHESEGLSVHLVTPKEIYNEFSSGMRDATAIKQFLRMFYVRGLGVPGMVPKYCLLFGDGTYDNRNRMGHGNNLIPVFQSYESLSVTSTYGTDDYYGILSDGASMANTDLLNIAVGRLPISSLDQANQMVQKIKNYSSLASDNSPVAFCSNGENSSVLRDWRNMVTLVSDDEDGNAYFTDIEIMASKVKVSNPEININKIHSDAFSQQSTPVGERNEGATEAIRQQVEQGSLLINYIGHGGETGWAHEQILTLPTINGWNNYQRMPVFMTATCEFSRFDDHDRTSAGEYVLLNPDGGGVGLFTTTRLVYASPNEWLNRYFYDTVFDKVNQLPQTLGEVYMGTKNKFAINSADANYRKFALLGDPAIRLAYPRMNIVADSVNGESINSFSDTIKALSLVRISGHIENLSSQVLSDFNGFVYSKIFDKESALSTLGTNTSSSIAPFTMWKNLVYKGKSSVTNGFFSFEFVVPQDISFEIGNARFSFYAEDGTIDANGFSEAVLIGGINENAQLDEQGPLIDLYMNDQNFVSGGITNSTPTLIANVFDENGINTVGNGIGHDIEAYLDGNTSEAIILNDFYESELDTYQRGQINYPLNNLEEGNHSITLKVWDVYNNSSKQTIDFEVVNNEQLALEHVLNYPNPFTTQTEFFFEHNQHCDFLDVQLQIFTISGKIVKTIRKRVHAEGFRVGGISWDAKDDYGDKIGRGVYVYTLKVSSENGEIAEKTEKLVILN